MALQPIFEGLFKNATGPAWCNGRIFYCSATVRAATPAEIPNSVA